jgi:hypothetical protein
VITQAVAANTFPGAWFIRTIALDDIFLLFTFHLHYNLKVILSTKNDAGKIIKK